MADFVKDAFKQAVGASMEEEYQAFNSEVSDHIGEIILTAGIMVGLDDMERLSGLVIRNGMEDTLTEFIKGIAMASFHAGYTKGRESA